jgi:isopenicillin-N N-acyltransferase-like protein
MRIARRSGEFAQQYAPDLVDELRGTAEAAGVTLDDLMLLQVRNQLLPELESGCSSLSWPATPQRPAIVAQNWDNDPVLDQFTIVLTRRPTGQPALITCTQAGLISYMGFNDAGIGACVNTLPAPSRGIGVPHYFTLRGIFQARSLEQAVEAVQRAHRAIPVNIILATPQGPADLEVTIDQVHVLRPRDGSGLFHTNHCLHDQLRQHNDVFPELIQSHARERRLDQLLLAANNGNVTLESIKSTLRDHQNYPRSICRHANDDVPYGFWETVFSIIIEPDQRRMHISRGTPCTHDYETYWLN